MMIRKVSLGVLLVLMSFFVEGQNLSFKTKLSYSIEQTSDDAEQRQDASMYLNSSDLELTYDNTSKQLVGLRFSNIDLNKNAQIDSAFIQFTCKAQNSNTTSLILNGELSANASTFNNDDNNIGTRNRTLAKINWQPEPWTTVGASGRAQQTPDLKDIVSEIIQLPDWENANALVFVIDGEGKHNAASYDHKTLNAPQLVIYTSVEAATERIQNVLINEVQADESTYLDEFDEADDWFELYNANDTPVYVGGLFFSDDLSELTKWQLTVPLVLPARSYQLFWADKDEEQGPFHTNFKLNKEGETLYLSQYKDAEVHILDSIQFASVPKNSSIGRNPLQLDQILVFGTPTPNAANNPNEKYLKKPIFPLKQGIYEDSIVVEIMGQDEGSKVYYTLDGTTPSDKAILYAEPIKIDSATIIKAICAKEGYANSTIAYAFYSYNTHNDLPVLHLSVDPEILWDESNGIYVIGENGIPLGNRYAANWNNPLEFEGKLAYFDTKDNIYFSKKCGAEIGGNASKYQPQKSFNVHFKEPYSDEWVEESLFKNRETEKYKHLKIRNGGQDFQSMLFRDGLNHAIVLNKLDFDVMAYRPVVLYLNGEYWGIYGLRESFTDEYINTYHDVKKDSLNIINKWGANPEVVKGSSEGYQFLYNFAKNNDLRKNDNFITVDSLLHLNSFIDYNLTQIYLGNYDWPANNVRMWQERPSGKWRYMLYDTDASANFGGWNIEHTRPERNTLEFVTSETSSSWPNNKNSNVFLRQLLKNEAFAAEFAQRAQTYMYTVFDSIRVHHIVDSVYTILEPEIDGQIGKWSHEYPEWGTGITCGGSYEAWMENIHLYKAYFTKRPKAFTTHLKSFFKLDTTFNLHLNFDEHSNGSVVLHKNDFKIIPHFENEYFKQTPLRVKAVPDSGYAFVRWDETGDTSQAIQFSANKDAILTPIFEARISMPNSVETITKHEYFNIYPNPTVNKTTMLAIKGLHPKQLYTISVRDVLGRTVKEFTFTAHSKYQRVPINLRRVGQGNYSILIQGDGISKAASILVR